MISEKIDFDYETLLSMLNSDDTENITVALTSLENIQTLPNIIKVLLLRKESKAGISLWSKYAPTVVTTLQQNGIPFESTVTFKQIAEAGITHNADKEHVQLLVDRINVQVYKDLQDIGYDYLKSINVTLNYAE